MNELCFVTFEKTTGNLIFWLYDTCGLFFNSETAEFFRCPVTKSFDVGRGIDMAYVNDSSRNRIATFLTFVNSYISLKFEYNYTVIVKL